MIKNRVGLLVVAAALAASASTCLACGDDAKAEEAKDVKVVAAAGAAAVAAPVAAAKTESAGCNMPCCAHADTAAEPAVLAVAVADDKAVGAKPEVKPCGAANGKGCPKKAAAAAPAVAKAEPAQDTAQAAPAVDPGAKR